MSEGKDSLICTRVKLPGDTNRLDVTGSGAEKKRIVSDTILLSIKRGSPIAIPYQYHWRRNTFFGHESVTGILLEIWNLYHPEF